MDFYKDAQGWKIGTGSAPAGQFVLSTSGDKIYVHGIKQLANGAPVTQLNKNVEGEKYTDLSSFILATSAFFAANPNVSLGDSNGDPLTPINPLPTTLDIIYEQDIDWELSEFPNWLGNPKDLFGNVNNGGIFNASGDNPKSFILRFIRTRQSVTFGLGAHQGDFSNIKVTILGSADTERGILDLSEDSSKRKSTVYSEEVFTYNALKVEFHTVDRVDISNIFIQQTFSDKDVDYTEKFGRNGDIDAGVKEVIWTIGDMYTFTTVPQDYYISSSDNTDIGEVTGEILYINTEGRKQAYKWMVALQGFTLVKIPIPNNALCVASNRAENNNGTVFAGDVYIQELGTVTNGVPDDLSLVRSHIASGREQTEQTPYTVAEFTELGQQVARAEIYKWSAAIIKNRTASGIFDLVVIEPSKTPKIKSSIPASENFLGSKDFGISTPKKVAPGSDVYVTIDESTISGVAAIADFTIKLVVL